MKSNKLSFADFKTNVIKDYEIAYTSRQASIVGRKEVLNGRGKFGIFGDGKEVPQVVLAKYMQAGDFRSGYYRDQTLMLALGVARVENLFAQLYGNTDDVKEPFCGGRQMNSHFSSRFINDMGEWVDLTKQVNIACDIAPTASQVPRAVGLAMASKLFRHNKDIAHLSHLSKEGNEVVFCTIGDGATSEGHFWESINAMAVMQIPLVVVVWDDGYGISVPKQLQTAKGSVSEALKGFAKTEKTNGVNIVTIKGWDYASLSIKMEQAISDTRKYHIPTLIHIEELTQPLGHSTSGSHERYKSKERLDWENEWDCIKKMREWMIKTKIATHEELQHIEEQITKQVTVIAEKSWEDYFFRIEGTAETVLPLVESVVQEFQLYDVRDTLQQFKNHKTYTYKEILQLLKKTVRHAQNNESIELNTIKKYIKKITEEGHKNYNTHLYNENPMSALSVVAEAPVYLPDSPIVNGYEVLNQYFKKLFEENPKVVAFGEDVGEIGDVNQGFSGLQKKFGQYRIMDTGIREITIVGQGLGLALRGLRPIAEIQYLDYLIYGLQPLVDDVVTTHYRTDGKQACPLIIRTRGHRLEGIFHSGSPMGMIVNALRGMVVCVPRNMVQAIGMYNTLLKGNDPGIVIESLNGYRIKEKVPYNLLDFTIELGKVDILKEGTDVTIVSYGSTLRVVQEAVRILEQEQKVSCEIIDIQTLIPFDNQHLIVASLKKTNRIIFIDEDVSSGATAYMFQKVIEEQGGYRYLDAAPKSISAKDNRPAYGNDGDYFTKPNVEQIIETILQVCSE